MKEVNYCMQHIYTVRNVQKNESPIIEHVFSIEILFFLAQPHSVCSIDKLPVCGETVLV